MAPASLLVMAYAGTSSMKAGIKVIKDVKLSVNFLKMRRIDRSARGGRTTIITLR
jgi:hypothetical protein